MKKHYRDSVIKPVITEKTTDKKNRQNVYTFRIPVASNKLEVKASIQRIFGVEVIDVNMIKSKGKIKQIRYRQQVKRPDWKKAYVKIKEGQRIEGFEGV